MPDPLPPPEDRRDRPARTRILCEFCECQLSAHGEVLKRGPKATAMMKLDDDNEALRGKIADQDRMLADVRAQLAARPASDPPRPVPHGDGDESWV